MKIKKLPVLLVGIVLVLSLLATPLISGCGGGVPGGAEQITLVFANGYPRGHTCGSILVDAYIDRVTEMSEGKIQFDHQDAGKLLAFKDMLTGCKTGVADMTIPICSYISGEIPLVYAVEIPVCATVRGRTQMGWELSTKQPDVKAEFDKWNFKPLYGWPVDDSFIHLVKPISNPMEDLKGVRIRTSGGIVDDMLKALGAAPVNVPSPDTYLALQTGVADGAVMHLTSFWGWKWYEVCKYTLRSPVTYIHAVGWVGINTDKWNSLPKWAQDILAEAGEEHMDYMAKAMEEITADLTAQLEAQGHTFIKPTTQEWEQVRAVNLPIGDKWAAEHGDAGKRVWEFMKGYLGK